MKLGYSYWECRSCGALLRGDVRECPNCATPIPNGVKYLMPDDPKVVAAMKDGTIVTSGKVHISDKGIITEYAKEGDTDTRPNWLCEMCGFQNRADKDECEGCGAPKGDKNYFSDLSAKKSSSEAPAKESVAEALKDVSIPTTRRTNASSSSLLVQSSIRSQEQPKAPSLLVQSAMRSEKPSKASEPTFMQHLAKLPWKPIGIVFGAIMAILFFVWLFWPVQRVAVVDGFTWERAINVEEYQLCHENGWSVPSGGRVTRTAQEIHHYDHVIDHYETKSKQVAERVFDGYDTSYRDLGNGKVEIVETPRYRTEYHTEYYEVPVYKDVPVYQTKYYYDIDRWVYVYPLKTNGNDQNPYWYDTDLPKNVSSPVYGDTRQAGRSERYTVIILDEKGESQQFTQGYADWINYHKGDRLTYKSFRWNYTPLSEVQVEARTK